MAGRPCGCNGTLGVGAAAGKPGAGEYTCNTGGLCNAGVGGMVRLKHI